MVESREDIDAEEMELKSLINETHQMISDLYESNY